MQRHLHRLMLAAAFLLTAAVYWPGLSGGYLFDDYPNIVDNAGVQPHDAKWSSLVGAALSSPSSEFKRPLASLSFAVNYLVSGLNPYWMKLTNLAIHLLNGLLVFMLSKSLLHTARRIHVGDSIPRPLERAAVCKAPIEIDAETRAQSTFADRVDAIAVLITASWMLLPINLTGVLYIVQRMESMANLFVLLGLLGYITGRRRMLDPAPASTPVGRIGLRWGSFILCAASITVPAAIGVLAKETAVMLPLYAFLVEWTLFRFGLAQTTLPAPGDMESAAPRSDLRVAGLFLVVLAIPMVVGLTWLVPGVVSPATWASRDFTLGTRLLSESRVIVDYIFWIVTPTPAALSFYHDDFQVSTGVLSPWSTLACMALIAALIALTVSLRKRRPIAALGIALFLGCQLLTGTILPLELVYEHRNYFASFGLLLATVPMLAAPQSQPFALPRHVLLAGLILCWTALTGLTAYAWGDPLRLAHDLAVRAPQSPRAQYELGRTYIIYSHYDPNSPFTKLAYAPLEKASALPDGSILPEQALIFMNARMRLPLKNAWWGSMVRKLKARQPGVQDESSLGALTQCVREHRCDLPRERMIGAFIAALSHPNPSARLLATYGDYAWNVLDDHDLGERMTEDAVKASPKEAAYQITLIRMLTAQGRKSDAARVLKQLETMNIGGRLNDTLKEFRALPANPEGATTSDNDAQNTMNYAARSPDLSDCSLAGSTLATDVM
jgi:hypothetical protein